jgi:ribonuclease HI
MAGKYYAVKKGVNPGIYESWDECKDNVLGFPGAIFKGFGTIEEAREFLGEEKENVSKQVKLIPFLKLKMKSQAIAYVDGSYNESTGEYSYGMLLTCGDKEIEQCEAFSDPEMATMRNVAGEIEGSMHAMQYALDHGIKSIDIYYDYEGIEKWALGLWKTNKEGTIGYKKFYDSIKDKLEVHFHKVKGHSGDKGNDRADELAKSALGIDW